MALRTALFAALLLTACASPSEPTSGRMPVEVLCAPDGRLLALRLQMPGPGVITLRIPQDACDSPGEPVRHRRMT